MYLVDRKIWSGIEYKYLSNSSTTTLGRRIGKTIGTNSTGYLYDGANFVQELNGYGSSAAIKANLIAGPGIDQLLSRQTATGNQSMLSDALGSILLATDASQNIVTSYSYDAYGQTSQSGANDNSQQYTGRENDLTGLYYYRARYYSPALGRFISQDPIGWAAGQTNGYAYVGGNPLSNIDPDGLASKNPNICNGKDCVDPPYDPTPDGPKPSSQPKPPKKLWAPDDDAGRYDICQSDSKWKKKACKTCVDWACNAAGAGGGAYCCEVDRRKCIGGAVDDPGVMARCNAQYATCNFRGGK